MPERSNAMKASLKMKPAPHWDVRWLLGGALALAILILLAVVVIPRLRGPAPAPAGAAWLPPGWRINTPEEQGFDSAKLADGLLAMREQGIPIHSLLLVRNNAVILDTNFYPYDGRSVHDLASVTKSIMTTLIGIAADQGKLHLDDPLVSFFPDRAIANRDARKERITVRHLASMSSGLACTRATEAMVQGEMRAGPDWVQYALDRKVAWEPGTHFEYCALGMHLLSGILREATGMTALEFARRNLFGPLDIQDVLWPTDPQGNQWGWGNIYLRPHDLARIGALWVNGGQWEGRQIVSRAWVESAVTSQIPSDGPDDYGYGWWVGTGDEAEEYYADGNGGQRLSVYPSLNAMIVTTGGGFEIDQVIPYIGAALAEGNTPLPANPAGVARLNAALATLAQAPDQAQPVPPLPATAGAISGKTFVFASGSGSAIETLRLEFDDSAEARIRLTVVDYQPTRGGPVGLDGVYRISPGPDNLPEAWRGRWTDAQTFAVDYDRVANRERFQITLRFVGDTYDRVVFAARDRQSGRTIRAEGRAQGP
jgi:CubicO group peptidase (beta-lactamase class C family)